MGRRRTFGLVLGSFHAVAVVGLLISGTFSLQARRAPMEVDFVVSGQAGYLARSGIGEALNWFRAQPERPVRAFDPRCDETASPPVRETEEPDVGLVRELRIDGPYWGRYEVWKAWQADPDPERRAWREKMRVRDSSEQHGLARGSVWQITCVAYVYERVDPRKPYHRYPNRVLGSQVLQAEIGRITLSPVGTSALAVRDGSGLVMLPGSRASGGRDGAAITYPRVSRAPAVDPSRLDGAPIAAPVPVYDDSLRAVFGAEKVRLRAMADMVPGGAGEFPGEVRPGSLIFGCAGSVRLQRPLTGVGVVVHQGDLKLAPGTDFRGLLYVDGTLQVPGPAAIRGAVIATGEVILGGGAGPATLSYDADVLRDLQHRLGQYRLSGPLRSSGSGE